MVGACGGIGIRKGVVSGGVGRLAGVRGGCAKKYCGGVVGGKAYLHWFSDRWVKKGWMFLVEIFGQGVNRMYLCRPPVEIGWLVLNNQEKKGEKGEEKKRK